MGQMGFIIAQRHPEATRIIRRKSANLTAESHSHIIHT